MLVTAALVIGFGSGFAFCEFLWRRQALKSTARPEDLFKLFAEHQKLWRPDAPARAAKGSMDSSG
jgi:hypothetical protein